VNTTDRKSIYSHIIRYPNVIHVDTVTLYNNQKRAITMYCKNINKPFHEKAGLGGNANDCVAHDARRPMHRPNPRSLAPSFPASSSPKKVAPVPVAATANHLHSLSTQIYLASWCLLPLLSSSSFVTHFTPHSSNRLLAPTLAVQPQNLFIPTTNPHPLAIHTRVASLSSF
jgi:hypothetical protein